MCYKDFTDRDNVTWLKVLINTRVNIHTATDTDTCLIPIQKIFTDITQTDA